MRSDIHVVLVNPTGPANVGIAARAVKAFGLGSLRLVGPLPGGPGEAARWAARADDTLAAARRGDTLDVVLPADAWCVGTSQYRGGLEHDVETRSLRDGAPEVLAAAARQPVAVLFGPEAQGLPNDLLRRCALVLCAPTTEAYPSLNLAQAVSVVAYELAAAGGPGPVPRRAPAAGPEAVERFEARLLALLRRIGFTDVRQQHRAALPIRRLLARAAATSRDVQLLLGIVAALEQRVAT